MEMKSMVEEMYEDWKKVPQIVESLVRVEGERVGGVPPEPLSSPSSSSYSSEHSSHRKRHFKKSSHSHARDFPLLKLDIKFDFPIYDGDLNVEKLDNWIKQIEVYYRI